MTKACELCSVLAPLVRLPPDANVWPAEMVCRGCFDELAADDEDPKSGAECEFCSLYCERCVGMGG